MKLMERWVGPQRWLVEWQAGHLMGPSQFVLCSPQWGSSPPNLSSLLHGHPSWVGDHGPNWHQTGPQGADVGELVCPFPLDPVAGGDGTVREEEKGLSRLK